MDVIEIVLIEDNPDDAELMIRTLKKNKLANNLVLLKDGEAAIEFFFNNKFTNDKQYNQYPRVIFLDIKLPKISGLDVLRRLKNDKNTRNIPVIIVTSSTEDPDIRTAYDLGANSYVVKPVDIINFRDTIQKLGLYWLIVNEKAK